MSNRDDSKSARSREIEALEDVDMNEFMRELDRRALKREEMKQAAWSRVDDMMAKRRLAEELTDFGEDENI